MAAELVGMGGVVPAAAVHLEGRVRRIARTPESARESTVLMIKSDGSDLSGPRGPCACPSRLHPLPSMEMACTKTGWAWIGSACKTTPWTICIGGGCYIATIG